MSESSAEVISETLSPVVEINSVDRPQTKLDELLKIKTETPLTNQEKRDLLKPEALAQLSTEEYVDLWKRLNPHYLSHVTRQGFRDHNASDWHSAGLREFQSGFLEVMKDEKSLRPPLVLAGIKGVDETNMTMALSKWALQAEDEDEAKRRFGNLLDFSLGNAPAYPDKTAVHFAAQLVANGIYGGEKDNEVFFAFPADVLASRHSFAFNGTQKDFTKPQNDMTWNDVFIWPDSIEDPGIPIDSGLVFLPEKTLVDPVTGSKYASEIKMVDGKEKRAMTEDEQIVKKFVDWTNALSSDSPLIMAAYEDHKHNTTIGFDKIFKDEMRSIGVPEDSIDQLSGSNLSGHIRLFKDKPVIEGMYLEDFKNSNAIFKMAENTITAKEYWERFFVENPDLKPKHVVYYDGDPTTAVAQFEKQNGIGATDTSKTDGALLGFDNHHVTDMRNDPRANLGHDELVNLGNKIISEHYVSKS